MLKLTIVGCCKGSKGITDLYPILQNICGDSLVEKKDEFLQSFSTESHFVRNIVSNGEIIYSEAPKGHDSASDNHLEAVAFTMEHQIIRMNLSCTPVGQLYDRLVPFVHLFIEGGTPIDVTDPRWDIHFAVERKADQAGNITFQLLGFTTIYHFYHYPESSRLRLGQILVLPCYQGQGHGCRLLEALYSVAISENIYDVTIEDPSDYLQHVRTCFDTFRLQTFDSILPAITSTAGQLKLGSLSKRKSRFCSNPPANVVEEVRQCLKINRKQFLKCWEVLIYVSLDPNDRQCMENYRACVLHRMEADVLGKDVGSAGKHTVEVPNDYDHEMTFVMFHLRATGKDYNLDDEVGEDCKSQEEQLNRLVDDQMEEIKKVAQKVLMQCRSPERV